MRGFDRRITTNKASGRENNMNFLCISYTAVKEYTKELPILFQTKDL